MSLRTHAGPTHSVPAGVRRGRLCGQSFWLFRRSCGVPPRLAAAAAARPSCTLLRPARTLQASGVIAKGDAPLGSSLHGTTCVLRARVNGAVDFARISGGSWPLRSSVQAFAGVERARLDGNGCSGRPDGPEACRPASAALPSFRNRIPHFARLRPGRRWPPPPRQEISPNVQPLRHPLRVHHLGLPHPVDKAPLRHTITPDRAR